jgi:hypothetical protein
MLEANYFFPLVFLFSALVLTFCVWQLIRHYSVKHTFEYPALDATCRFYPGSANTFQIAIKRPYLDGVIPLNARFKIMNPSQEKVAVFHRVSISEQRKDLSGNRIVPVGEFEVKEAGEHVLINQNQDKFHSTDVIVIAPKNSSRIFWLILATLLSSVFSAGALVLTILFWSGQI